MAQFMVKVPGKCKVTAVAAVGIALFLMLAEIGMVQLLITVLMHILLLFKIQAVEKHTITCPHI